MDAYTTGIAINRALHLIDALGCGRIARDRFDIGANKAEPSVIKTSVSQINALLGIEVPKAEICDILGRLNFNVRAKGDALTVTAPAYREDVDGYPDLAEEVIRMYGYDHIEGTFLKNASVTQGGLTAAQRNEERTKAVLCGQGYSEIITYSFISPADYARLRMEEEGKKAIRIRNPISEEMSVMRTTLAPSMLETLVRNLRRGNAGARLYELANVYLAKELPLRELPEERAALCVGLCGAGEDLCTAKGAFEAFAAAFGLTFSYTPAAKPFLHPGKCAAVYCKDAYVGYLGELAPDLAQELSVEVPLYIGELDYAALAESLNAQPQYVPLPKFPEVHRDLAFVAGEEVTCAEAEKVISESCKYVTSVRLFDIYRGEQVGEGKKSMAFSLTFTPAEKAISPEDADGYVRRILKAMQEKLGAQLR